MSEKEKRCLYEVLDLSRECSADEIRSAYRKLALQRHPDKLIKSGLSEAEATAQFQELVNAYEVLSDPRERAWYDSHRSQILFSSTTGSSSNSVSVPDLFSYFSNSSYSGYSDSGKGFYKVYGDVFDIIFQNELTFAKKVGVSVPKEAPLIGNLKSPYEQVAAFYNYWVGFVTVMDFCWVDQYDVMMGPNRKSRRLMEEENKKLRKKARREYNETVRGLAEFAKKRDKRVIDMQLKKSEEMERKKEEERKRKAELARLKAEKIRNYEEPEWTKIDELLESEEIEEVVEENGKKDELYCIACGKKFKSEQQWKNHEQSKKHKEKVMELREAFDYEDRKCENEDTNGKEEAEEAVFPSDEFSEQIDKQMGIGENNDEPQSVDSDTDTISQEIEEVMEENGKKDELYCIASGKKFKSEKQWKNHEQSKKHKEKVMELREAFDDDEDRKCENEDTNGKEQAEEEVLPNDDFSELINKQMGIGEDNDEPQSVDSDTDTISQEQDFEARDEDQEASILESMVSGQKKKNKVRSIQSPDLLEKIDQLEFDNDEVDCMEYNITKGSRRNKGGRRQKNKIPEEAKQNGFKAEENTCPDDSSEINEQSCDSLPENFIASRDDNKSGKARKVDVEKNTAKPDKKFKSEESTKGKKKKGSAKVQSNACEKCGEKFETRNKLHKHLGDTGHATLKSR